MTTRSLIATAAAALVAGALLSTGAVAATAPTSDITKASAGKVVAQDMIQLAQEKKKKGKKKGKGKKKAS